MLQSWHLNKCTNCYQSLPANPGKTSNRRARVKRGRKGQGREKEGKGEEEECDEQEHNEEEDG